MTSQINYNLKCTSAITHMWMVWRQIFLVLVVLILFIGSRICCSLANDASYNEGQNSYWILWYVKAKVIPTLNHECDNFVRRKWTRKKMCACRLYWTEIRWIRKRKKLAGALWGLIFAFQSPTSTRYLFVYLFVLCYFYSYWTVKFYTGLDRSSWTVELAYIITFP